MKQKDKIFDLEQSIANWRQQMLDAGIETPVPLEELESHLRDEMEQQMRWGLSAQEALEIAAQRIGKAGPLGKEFKKVGTMERKQMKRVVAILAALFGMVFGLSIVLPQLGQWSRTGVMHSLTVLLLGVVLVIAGGSTAFYGIKTRGETRGRKLINIGIIAAATFYAMPLIFAFFQDAQTNLAGWIFCGFLTATSVLFFGICFHFNRSLPASTREL